MSKRKLPNGRWEARERVGGRGSRQLSKTFDRAADADKWCAEMRRRRQLGMPLERDDLTLDEFVITFWDLHAIPNLEKSTRDSYRNVYERHVSPRLGSRYLLELTPKVLTRFRSDLERGGVGTATVVKALAVVQSILSFAIVEEHLELNPMAAVAKPFYEREREPHVFLPIEVERIRARVDAKSAALIALLAYAGPRPEEGLRLPWQGLGERTVEFDGRKTRKKASGGRRRTPLLAPLAGDLKRWRLESGARDPKAPVIPAHDGGFWQADDWRNWRRRTWGSYRRDRKTGRREWKGVAPEGTRPRDLRSSFITLQVYAGVPLTTIAKWCGTSVAMIERHYAGVIEDWDGVRRDPEEQIRAARDQLRSGVRAVFVTGGGESGDGG
jgi:integrase